jgi:hypothetical protein
VSEIRLRMADVVALYPSIRLERGITALQWFMDNHTRVNQTLKDLCLRLLAQFFLTNNNITGAFTVWAFAAWSPSGAGFAL